MPDFVDQHYARGNEKYAADLADIERAGVCPFCPGQLHWHPHPVLQREGEWFLTRIRENYANAEDQFLIIGAEHKTRLEELSPEDFEAVLKLAKAAEVETSAQGGALCLRFGDTKWTGATVQHLHFHVVFPKIDEQSGRAQTVSFPIG